MANHAISEGVSFCILWLKNIFRYCGREGERHDGNRSFYVRLELEKHRAACLCYLFLKFSKHASSPVFDPEMAVGLGKATKEILIKI